MNKNFNKRAYEILRNYEILAFIDKKILKSILKILKIYIIIMIMKKPLANTIKTHG